MSWMIAALANFHSISALSYQDKATMNLLIYLTAKDGVYELPVLSGRNC